MRRALTFLRAKPLTFSLLPALIFLVIPAVVARINGISMFARAWGTWVALGVLAILGFVVVLLGELLFDALSMASTFRLFVAFGCYFVAFAGLLFPVSKLTGLISPERAPVDGFHVGLCLVLATVALLARESRFGELWNRLLVTFVILNLGLVVVWGLTVQLQGEGSAEFRASIASPNIFVLSFDSLNGSVMRGVIDRKARFRASLSGFVVYDSVASTSPATSGSIAAELSGNRDFKTIASTDEDLWTSLSDDLVTNVLGDNGFEVKTYGQYAKDLSHGMELRPLGSAVASTNLLVWSSVARTLTRAFVWKTSIAGNIAMWLGGSADANEGSSILEEISLSNAPPWATELTASVLDFERLLNELDADGDGPTAFFMHFTHTHFPVEFDEDCAFKADDRDWYLSRQNPNGAEGEALCAASQFEAFLARLRALGIFRDSLIVLKSDHGKPLSYAVPGTQEAARIRGHPDNGMSRYSPFLAIKPFGVDEPTGGPEHDQRPVILDDLARTLCEESGVKVDCNRYPGFNMIREDVVIPEESQVTILVVDSELSDYRYRTHSSIEVRRGTDVRESLYEALVQDGSVVSPDND